MSSLSSGNRYLCLHLHYYQPPRENPWLGEIEYQESAYPFHDWNERINFECYRANGMSRVLDSEGRVVDLSNNYAKTSFNFGPTLLSWLEDKDPNTYERILEGDRLSQKLFDGHGSAIAQAYNHMIMPLANARDKETQIIWGLRDFETRFKRLPEAMWLPETAVDTESLEMLSAHGMKYVILAPRQAKAVRSLSVDQPWQDMGFEKIDPREPYLIRLPSGRSIVGFFYDGPISKAVAFEGLLHNGETFANRLLSGFRNDPAAGNQLLHIATDGETYGHHHRYGDMALAFALSHVEKNQLAKLTNYGQYLEIHPPRFEAQIHENSSWSCAHGVARWKSDCGCNSGTKGNWHQKWREPLRNALDLVRDRFTEPFETMMKAYTDDPWGMRNAYIKVIENRLLANIEGFLENWCREPLKPEQTSSILKALEAQRHLLLMYTSCAWFFDEISGIETIQNLQYAYRAIELGEEAFGVKVLEEFKTILKKAESNLPEIGDGKTAFERYAQPARVDNLRVGVHFGIASIFETFGQKNEVYNNKITLLDFHRHDSGKARFACGRARVRSRITLERHNIVFGVVHLGDHNVSAGIMTYRTAEEYQALVKDASTAFARADFPETIRVFDRHFGSSTYSLKDLFKDEQKRVIDVIMSETMQETEERFARLYKNNYPLLCYFSDGKFPLPKVFEHVAEFVQNRGLRRTLLAKDRVRTDLVKGYLDEAKSWNVPLDSKGLVHDLEQVIEAKMLEFELDDSNIDKLDELVDLVSLHGQGPFAEVHLGSAQNWFFLWYKLRFGARGANWQSENATPEEKRFEETVKLLGEQLRVKLPETKLRMAGTPGGNQGGGSEGLSEDDQRERQDWQDEENGQKPHGHADRKISRIGALSGDLPDSAPPELSP